MNSENLLFHDGMLNGMHFCLGDDEEVVLDMDLYRAFGDLERVGVRLIVSRPDKVLFSLDYDEYRRNKFAGVISDGILIQGEGEEQDCLRLYVCGGYIEVKGAKINLEEA